MRKNTRKPIEDMQIDRARTDEKSRDDIPQLIFGLQFIFLDVVLREQIFKILESIFPKDLDLHNGRPGMDLWSIFVMAVIRTNLNCDYDRLHNLVNNHKTLRHILGHGLVDDQEEYCLQTLKDNVRLLTPEALAQIDQLIIQAGHEVLKKKPPKTPIDPLSLAPLMTRFRGAVIRSSSKPTWNIRPIPVCYSMP
jgi:hypothetical protein